MIYIPPHLFVPSLLRRGGPPLSDDQYAKIAAGAITVLAVTMLAFVGLLFGTLGLIWLVAYIWVHYL